MDTSFRDRFNAWKQGKTVYKNGLRISFDEGKDANPEQPVEQPDLSAALDYVRGVKRDVLLNFDEGKDVAGGHHFNAIKQISPNAGLSYGSYYDKLTGDWMIDARRQGLPRFRGGKNSGFRPTPRQLRTINVIVQNLRDAGFNDYDIAGILANGKIESSFDPAAVNKSDHRGVWQNETVRHRGVSKVYGDHSLGSQIKYLIDWEASGGKPTELLDDTLAAHGNVIFKKGTYKSAREAALAFERAYERSNGQIMGGRLNQADMIYDWLRATSPGSIVVNNSNTDRPLIGSRRIIPPTQRVVTTTPPPAAPTNAGLWDNLAIPRPLVPYDDGKDVDTRSDTTRQGYHEGNIPWGAGLDSGGQGPLWLLENVGAGMGNPNLITGHAPATSISTNTLNLQRAAAPYLNKVSGKSNALTREYRARFGDLFDTRKVTDRQLNAVMYGRGLAASAEQGKYGAYNSATNRLNVMDNGHIKTMSSIDYENGHYITEYMQGAPGTHGNVKDQLSALQDLGRQRRSPVYTGEDWVATIPHQHAAEALGYKKVGDYGRHENYTLVGDNAKKVIVHTPEQAEKAHRMGYHFIHNNAPVYQVTKNASGITTKDINLVDPRAIDSTGKIPFDLNVHDMYRAMLPFAVGGGLWANHKNKHRERTLK